MIFASRIVGTARAAGLGMRAVRSAVELQNAARQAPPPCVIIDLGNPGLVVADLLVELREASPRMPYVVAYGSHVDAQSLRSARQAGCDIAWPRSKFVDELERSLPAWLTGHASGSVGPDD
jgi:DNA-binding NarL/FixJ family response regulator